MTAKRKLVLVQVPNELTHFTTLPGLLGIVENRCLWASNVSFLNDRRELQHGISAAEKVLRDFATAQKKQIFAQIIDEVIIELKKAKLPDTYATCFCKAHDLLSQWRGYGGRVQGVSVTFNGKQLDSLFRSHGGIPMEVIYDKQRTVDRMRRSIVTFSGLADLLREKDVDKIRFELIRRLPKLVPRFKDDGFSEENEWRFVIQKENDFEHVRFRDADGVLVPYLEVAVPIGKRLPIKRVTVGPGKNQELTMRSVQLFLEAKGYERVPVEPSAVPYRS
ncbi:MULTISPECIES: DUF2971 domain-containing protein [unclassified Mesorhizobium]|uniref:DUF2971 domain-containing protein n=1 Tax=unclassified Mesorhizobium TaxID=325217 RepID=UPI001129A0E1|nr:MULTISPECIES: DUF2971 domain-containing protein [unclassified Mesorhizobium]MBZ9974206.1 DUF2971 domain-containing protein [Mesorhizobium sp. BR-1-1-10]TPK10295.1 DUF2971 domain-containing protein [Mesorhizobium sp. B2-5-7]